MGRYGMTTNEQYLEKLLRKLHDVDPTAKITCIVHDSIEIECKEECSNEIANLLKKTWKVPVHLDLNDIDFSEEK